MHGILLPGALRSHSSMTSTTPFPHNYWQVIGSQNKPGVPELGSHCYPGVTPPSKSPLPQVKRHWLLQGRIPTGLI